MSFCRPSLFDASDVASRCPLYGHLPPAMRHSMGLGRAAEEQHSIFCVWLDSSGCALVHFSLEPDELDPAALALFPIPARPRLDGCAVRCGCLLLQLLDLDLLPLASVEGGETTDTLTHQAACAKVSNN